jgi:hypothetical protein
VPARSEQSFKPGTRSILEAPTRRKLRLDLLPRAKEFKTWTEQLRAPNATLVSSMMTAVFPNRAVWFFQDDCQGTAPDEPK